METDRPPDPVAAPAGRALAGDYLEALLIALVFAVFARTWVVQAFKIPSGSMETTLVVGDHILVNKFIYGGGASGPGSPLLPSRAVRRGDVVIFKYPQEPWRDFIKRCVGLPGDTLEIVDRRLLVNGAPVEEPYAYFADDRVFPRSHLMSEPYRQRDNYGPYTVPDGHYFCLGDNRNRSGDSRLWGPVPASYVKGRALLIYWSNAAAGPPEAAPDDGGRLRRIARALRDLPRATRWDRTFRLVR